MTDTINAANWALYHKKLRRAEQEFIELPGLVVELARCTPSMRQALLSYISPELGGRNPLSDIEALEDTSMAEAAVTLSTTMLSAGRDDDEIEDAMASLRSHLEEHFRLRKLARLYEGR